MTLPTSKSDELGGCQGEGCQARQTSLSTDSFDVLGTPHPLKGVGAGAKLSGTVPSSTPPNTLMPVPFSSVTELIADLCETRQRVDDGIAYLQNHTTDPARFKAGEERLLNLVVREYLPGLQQIRRVERRVLHRERMTIRGRLRKGWSIQGDRADDLFEELVARYAVLTDALRRDFLLRLSGRIGRVQRAAQ